MKLGNIKFYVRGYLTYRKLAEFPIIIGGCERSGTSLLQSILSAHHKICAVNEETWAFCYGAEAGFHSGKVIRISRLYKALGKAEVLSSHSRWCEKSPANIFYFDEILDYYSGDVRLIHIVRDGRDVVTSMHPLNPTKPWVSIERWTSVVDAAIKYKEYQQVLTIRYEDLIEKYNETIAKICKHIAVEVDHQILDWHDHATIKNSKNLIGRKVEELSNLSIRKFESDNFNASEVIREFKSNSKAVRLLTEYGYK